MEVGIFIALIGGIISFISPCVLPMIPMYIAYISGISVREMEGGRKPMMRIFVNSLAFVLGFTVIFTVLAALFYLFATSLGQFKIWFERIAGAILVVFGLHVMGVITIPFLNFEVKAKQQKKDPTLISSFVMGLAFGAGWTPCIGPILSAILFSSTTTSSIGQAIILLIVYSLGIGIPFILTGLATKALLSVFDSIKKHYKTIEIISGAFLILVGIMLIFGLMGKLSGWFSKIFPGAEAVETRLLPDNDPPSIFVDSPDDGSVVNSTFDVVLRITDREGSGVKEWFLDNGAGFAAQTGTEGLLTNTISLTTTGSNTIRFYAIDKNGNTGRTNSLRVFVKPLD